MAETKDFQDFMPCYLVLLRAQCTQSCRILPIIHAAHNYKHKSNFSQKKYIYIKIYRILFRQIMAVVSLLDAQN